MQAQDRLAPEPTCLAEFGAAAESGGRSVQHRVSGQAAVPKVPAPALRALGRPERRKRRGYFLASSFDEVQQLFGRPRVFVALGVSVHGLQVLTPGFDVGAWDGPASISIRTLGQ